VFGAATKTETSVVRRAYDALCFNDSVRVTEVVILELCDAFDTIDHESLLTHAATDIKVTGVALSWFRFFSWADHLSNSRPVICVVPQGSVLEPLLICINARPLEQSIELIQIQYRFYSMNFMKYSIIYIPLFLYFSHATLNLPWIG